MKKIALYTLAFAIVAIPSCHVETDDPNALENLRIGPVELTVHAVMADNQETKTALQSDGTSVYWSPGDAISLFRGAKNSGSFTATNTSPAATTNFTGTLNIEEASSGDFWGIYPYDANNTCDGNSVTLTVPDMQEGKEGSFAPGAFPSVAKSKNLQLSFYNVCGGIVFTVTNSGIKSVTVKGKGDEILAGKVKVAFQDGTPKVTEVIDGKKSVTLTAPGGEAFAPGKRYFIATLPTTLSSGYTLDFAKSDSEGTYVKTTASSINRSRFRVVENADENITFESKGNIVFADAKVKEKLVAAFDTSGDGELSFAEAAAVTSIDGVFGETKGYTSFDEFQYFTSVTSVPNQMFQDWALLESIVLPESITYLGWYAFRSCSMLKAIAIPDGVKSIKEYTFYGCGNLATVSLPKSLETIGVCAFDSCTSLGLIELPHSLIEIGAVAFGRCSNLRLSSNELPNGLKTIGYSAFTDCSQIKSLIIPDSVTTIGYSAFRNSGLQSIKLPAGLEIITIGLFQDCKDLSSITIPDTVFRIENSAFKNTGLETIILPKSLNEISYDAFYGCKSLISVSFSNKISLIGARAFAYCDKLSTLSIPESVTSIGAGAFELCTGLSSIYLLPSAPPSVFNTEYISSSPVLNKAGDCPIFVPVESVDMYKASDGWSMYADRIVAVGTLIVVDLGLSVKWAFCNLGASSPEEYGDYFAWGETETKTNYSWDNYVFNLGANELGPFSKYNYTDRKFVLALEDDVAHVKLGGNWRMPTADEYIELSNNCIWERTSFNGVSGYKVTSRVSGHTDKWIFLPAAGYRGGYGLYSNGENGYYWASASSILDSDASRLWFHSTGQIVSHEYRYRGFSIRPVLGNDYVPVTSIQLNKTSLTIEEYSDDDLMATVSPENATHASVVWSSSDESVVIIDPQGHLAGVSAGTATITASSPYESSISASCSVTVTAIPQNFSVPTAVDLGLSVKWASFNLGASHPEGYGYYYAWGETVPKGSYLWETYSLCNGVYTSLAKYNNNSSLGPVDNKSILEPADDVAHVKLGGNWRMPTAEEFNELKENCSWEWTTINEVAGYKATSKVTGHTDKWIFLPATGSRVYSYRYDDGSQGYYWSSSLYETFPQESIHFYIDNGKRDNRSDSRDTGCTIRPVYAE